MTGRSDGKTVTPDARQVATELRYFLKYGDYALAYEAQHIIEQAIELLEKRSSR